MDWLGLIGELLLVPKLEVLVSENVVRGEISYHQRMVEGQDLRQINARLGGAEDHAVCQLHAVVGTQYRVGIEMGHMEIRDWLKKAVLGVDWVLLCRFDGLGNLPRQIWIK